MTCTDERLESSKLIVVAGRVMVSVVETDACPIRRLTSYGLKPAVDMSEA